MKTLYVLTILMTHYAHDLGLFESWDKCEEARHLVRKQWPDIAERSICVPTQSDDSVLSGELSDLLVDVVPAVTYR